MSSASPAPYRLSLLGPWDLRGPDGRQVNSILAQPKRLCLLAYLASSGEPVSRSTLVALFWPERDEERARNALSQSLHYLRRSLSARTVESVEGDRVRVPADRVWFDARALLRGDDPGARPRGDAAGGAPAGGAPAGGAPPGDQGGERADPVAVLAAARRIRGGYDFFEGWNAEDSQPLQEWLDDTRRRVREKAAEVVAEADRERGTEGGGEDGGGTARPDDGGSIGGGGARLDDGGASEGGGAGGHGAGGRGEAGGSDVRYRSGGADALGGRDGEDHGPVGSTRSANADARRRTRRRARAAWVAGGAVLGILLAIGVLRSGEGASEADVVVGDGSVEVAVLLPRVTAVAAEPAFPIGAFAAAVHDEVVARLMSRGGAEIVSVPFESEVSQLVRSLEAQGAIDPAQGGADRPEWVVSISVRTGDGRASVIGQLLRGPGYTGVDAAIPLDYPLPSGADVLLELPRQIAADVVEGLGGVGWPRTGSPPT